jgi:hypothetical protein
MEGTITATPEVTQGGTAPAAAPEGGAQTAGAVEAPASWVTSLTDESLRTHPGLSKFKDVESLAKSYVELDQLRRDRSGVKPLTETSTPEEVAAYRQAMGVPEAPEKYELGDLEYPEELTPSQEALGEWRNVFHGLHLTAGQAQALMKAHATIASRDFRMLQQSREQAVAEFQRAGRAKHGAEWGNLLTHVEQWANKEYGAEAMETLGFQPGSSLAAGQSPLIVDLIMADMKNKGEDPRLFLLGNGQGGIMSKEAARAKREDLAAQYFRLPEDSPERPAIHAEMNRLAPLMGS